MEKVEINKSLCVAIQMQDFVRVKECLARGASCHFQIDNKEYLTPWYWGFCL